MIDDVWATIGSDNFNRRSWTHDSELTAAVVDRADGDRSPYAAGPPAAAGRRAPRPARRRSTGADGADGDTWREVMADCLEPEDMVATYAACADALDAWHAGGRVWRAASAGTAASTQDVPDLPPRTRIWARLPLGLVQDPDGTAVAGSARPAFLTARVGKSSGRGLDLPQVARVRLPRRDTSCDDPQHVALVAVAATVAGTLALAPTSTAKPPTGSDTATAWVFMVNPVQSSNDQTLTDQKDAKAAVPMSAYADGAAAQPRRLRLPARQVGLRPSRPPGHRRTPRTASTSSPVTRTSSSR